MNDEELKEKAFEAAIEDTLLQKVVMKRGILKTLIENWL